MEIYKFFLRKVILFVSDNAGRLRFTSTSFHIVFPYIFNFPAIFSERHRRRRQRKSPFTCRILRGIFLCRQIGLLRSQLSYLRNAFSREPCIFSPVYYLGASSYYVLLPPPFLFPSFLVRFFSLSIFVYLTQNSRASQSAAQLLKQPIPTESPSLLGVRRCREQLPCI